MSSGFFFMAVTVSAAVAVYYLWTFKLGLNENTGLFFSTLAAILLSVFFYKARKK